jgi:hypothetical protein
MSVEAIALREQGAPDLPPDWRGDARVGQIELGRAQGCLRDLNLGGSNIESGTGFVESGLGRRLAFDQLLLAGKGAFRILSGRFGARDLGAGRGNCRLVLVRLDLEQRVAGCTVSPASKARFAESPALGHECRRIRSPRRGR